MEIQELFARLDRHRGSFPEDLVSEAVARRDETIPFLLETLEGVDRDPQPWLVHGEGMVHIYGLYLLALFRETRAYPIIVRIFSRPGEFAFDLAGDVVTESLGQILASVSGGDVSGMTALIENEGGNEYVRSVAMEAMVSLVEVGQRTRDEVMSYFLRLFQILERRPNSHWDTLANLCTDLWPHEALDELRRAYEDGLVDPRSIAWEDVEEALSLGKECAFQRSRHREPLITDLRKAMGWMQCLHSMAEANELEESDLDFNEDIVDSNPDENIVETFRRVAPKIGRNEPCPCGSGKKYKKCCGVC